MKHPVIIPNAHSSELHVCLRSRKKIGTGIYYCFRLVSFPLRLCLLLLCTLKVLLVYA